MMARTVIDVSVTGVERRRKPSKHYVYVLNVTWSDNSATVAYRRYSQFFDFQSTLLDTFPTEAGIENPKDRCIPFLPGKILFGRSHVRDVAVGRLKALEDYCKALVRLPSKISQCNLVTQFFEPTYEDLTPRGDRDSDSNSSGSGSMVISNPVLTEQYRVGGGGSRGLPHDARSLPGSMNEISVQYTGYDV